jgi:hypothetical protein
VVEVDLGDVDAAPRATHWTSALGKLGKEDHQRGEGGRRWEKSKGLRTRQRGGGVRDDDKLQRAGERHPRDRGAPDERHPGRGADDEAHRGGPRERVLGVGQAVSEDMVVLDMRALAFRRLQTQLVAAR